MGRLALFLTAAVTLLLPACSQMVAHGFNGMSISERGGQLYVDEVLVEHHREVEVALDAAQIGELSLSVPTGLINLEGVPGQQGHLILDVYTEIEGDGEVFMAGGKVKLRSTLRGKLIINGVRGSIPAGMSLDIDTGTGQVLLTALQNADTVEVDTGTGPVRLVDCKVGNLDVDSGTADIRLEGVHGALFDVDTGTGDVVLQDCHFDQLRGDTGTGDFLLTMSQIDSGRFNSGTGDVRLVDTIITHIRASLGTGDVISDMGSR